MVCRLRQLGIPSLLAVSGCLLMQVNGALAAESGPYDLDAFQGDLSLWAVPTFILFILAVKTLGWDSFVTGMNNREAEENRLIGEAEQARREAEEMLREHKGRLEAIDETIQAMIDEAHKDAEITRADIISTARREAETLRKRALTEISRVRDQALDEIFLTLSERVIASTEQRLATQLSADEQDRLVEEALVRFESAH